jgi:hypothetical protein
MTPTISAGDPDAVPYLLTRHNGIVSQTYSDFARTEVAVAATSFLIQHPLSCLRRAPWEQPSGQTASDIMSG